MYCKFCHRPIADDSLVCPHCGKPNTPSPKKKLSAVWVFIFTFVFLLVVGLAASAFPHIQKLFSDKKVGTPITDEGETLPTFTKESTESIHGSLGNSIANYSSASCSLVECKEYIFHCYAEDYQITMVEKSSLSTTLLPINGFNLSIYNNNLFCVPLAGDTIYAYDFLTGEVYEPNLPVKPREEYTYRQFFVTDCGYIIVYNDFLTTEMICVADFDGNILAQKSIPDYYISFITENFLVTRNDKSLVTLSLPSLEESTIICPEEFTSFESFGDGFLYHIHKSTEEDYIIKLNPFSGEYEKYYVDDLKYSYYLSYNNGILYYASQDGTSMISTSGKHLGIFNPMFHISNMTFTKDGYVYGMAEYKSYESTDDFYSFFVRLKADGTELTALQ